MAGTVKNREIENDIYYKLQRHLNTFVLGAPESDAFLEILRIRFTPEEAEIGLLLKQTPEDLPKLAESAGINIEVLHQKLEQMADKGLVLKETKTVEGEEKQLYSLLPTAVGLWETSFAKGETDPKSRQLAHFWCEYYKDGWGESMFTAEVPFTRIIPIEDSVSSDNEVYAYEQASELLKRQDYICVLHCPCRMAARLAGNSCDNPTETCLHFGDMARFLVEKEFAREVSLKEALEILDMTEKAGLVHMVGNAKEMGAAMCSCCTCCCTQLRAIREFAKSSPEAMAPSRFVATVAPETCVICGECQEKCQFDAISLGEEAASVDPKKCLGCGLCASACPEEAMSLKERESYERDIYREPLETNIDLAKAFLKGKK